MSKASISRNNCSSVGSLFIVGCATKGYVRNSIEPIDQKVDQVDQEFSEPRYAAGRGHQQDQSGQWTKTRRSSPRPTRSRRRPTARPKARCPRRIKIPRTWATCAPWLRILTTTSPSTVAVVHFGVNKDTLTKDEKAKLDEVATQIGSLQRYFITVEGFTDQTGRRSLQRSTEPCSARIR